MFEYARLLCGGRGFAMSTHALMTAAQEKLPIAIVMSLKASIKNIVQPLASKRWRKGD